MEYRDESSDGQVEGEDGAYGWDLPCQLNGRVAGKTPRSCGVVTSKRKRCVKWASCTHRTQTAPHVAHYREE